MSRREHDNLCRQVDEILRTLQRVEAELLAQSGRIGSLESAVERNRRHAS